MVEFLRNSIMEKNKAYLLEEGGDIHEVTPINPAKGFECKELYKMLQCRLVQVVPLANGQILICDEESKLVDEPIINKKATELYCQGRPTAAEYRAKMKAIYGDSFIDCSSGDYDLDNSICGHVVVCPPDMFQ